MDLPGKDLQLSPELLLARQLGHALVAQVAAAQFGHQADVVEEAGEGVAGPIGVLPDFDDPLGLSLAEDGDGQQDKVAGVAGRNLSLGRFTQSAVGRQDLRFALAENQSQQPVMAGPGPLVPIHPGQLEVDMVGQLNGPLGRAQPDRPGRCRQGFQQTLERLAEEIGGGDVGFRQTCDFIQQSAHALPFLFDLIVGLGSNPCRHWATSFNWNSNYLARQDDLTRLV